MGAHSFPLLAYDYSGNQYEREWPGVNAKEAAESLAKSFGYKEVRSNDKSRKLVNYRQPLYKADSAKPNGTSLLGMLLDNILIKTGPKIVEHLRAKGMTIELTPEHKLAVHWPIHVNVSEKDREGLRSFVEPHKQIIIDALKAEEASKKPPAVEEKADPLKGKKQRDIVLSMLPQMPTPFTREDFADRLKAGGYITLAADTKRIVSALYYCTRPGGECKLVGPAKFEVLEQCRHRKPVAEPVAETVEPPPPVAPPPVEIPPPVQALPEPEPEPVIPEPVIAPPSVNPLAAILDFASQAMSGSPNGAALAAKLTEAAEMFEMAQLDAVSALTGVMKEVATELRQQHTNREAIARTLTGN